MTNEHFDILTLTIGMTTGNYRRKLSWWTDNDNHRNHFATEEGCSDHPTILELVEMGLMKRGSETPGGLTYFHVNAHGIDAVRREFFARRKEAEVAQVG